MSKVICSIDIPKSKSIGSNYKKISMFSGMHINTKE